MVIYFQVNSPAVLYAHQGNELATADEYSQVSSTLYEFENSQAIMDTATKNKSLISIIIFLLITNIAMLIFFLVLNKPGPKKFTYSRSEWYCRDVAKRSWVYKRAAGCLPVIKEVTFGFNTYVI